MLLFRWSYTYWQDSIIPPYVDWFPLFHYPHQMSHFSSFPANETCFCQGDFCNANGGLTGAESMASATNGHILSAARSLTKALEDLQQTLSRLTRETWNVKQDIIRLNDDAMELAKAPVSCDSF